MKKVLYILLFLFSFTRVFAQQNSYTRGDSIFFTNKTKTAIIVLQNATKDSTGGFAKNIGHGVLNYVKINISDIRGLSDSLGKKIYFSDNFKYVDTVIDFADTIQTTFANFYHGLTIGNGADTARRFLTVHRKTGSDDRVGRFGVTSADGGGAQMQTDGPLRTSGLYLPINRNWPVYTPNGSDTYRVWTSREDSLNRSEIITSCVGCTFDYVTGILTASGGGGDFLPLTFPSDQFVNMNGHILEFDALYNGNGTYMRLDSLSGLYVNSGGFTNSQRGSLTVDTLESTVSYIDGSGGVTYIASANHLNGAELSEFNGSIKKGLFIMDSFNGEKITDPLDNFGLWHDDSIDRNTWTDNSYIDKRYLDSTLFVAPSFYNSDGSITTGGGFRSVTLNDNEIYWIGNSPSNDVYTKMWPSGNIGIHVAAAQADNHYALYITNGGGNGMISAGELQVDNTGHLNVATKSPGDNTTSPASTAFVTAAVAAGGGGAAWGSITGTLSSQSDLNTALGLKAPLASPTLTGTPLAPTATGGTNTTQIATTAFVQAAVSGVTVPTGANPTASIGFTAVNGSAGTFTRSDGAAKADSTVIRSVANSYSLSGMQTKLNSYALTSSLPVGGNPSGLLTYTAANGSASTFERTDGLHAIDSTVVRSVANSRSLAQTQTALNLKANIASPTFTGTVTIPNGGVFGTPTSMTATNVTGLPLTTGVTGILPNANTTAVSTATASTIALKDASGNTAFNNVIEGFATTANAGGTTTLTVSSTPIQHFTGTAANQTVVLPVASTLSQGFSFTISNDCTSTGIVTVQSSGANTIYAQAGGTIVTYQCILTSGTGVASWSINYGLGSTSLSANTTINLFPSGTGLVNFASGGTTGFRSRSSGSIDFVVNNNNIFSTSSNFFDFKSNTQFGWSSGDPTTNGGDIGLGRSAAGVLDVTDAAATGAGHLAKIRANVVRVAGNTSGEISITPQAAAGTYEFDLPITVGTAGQVLTSQGGAGTAMTWTYPLTKPHTIFTPTTGGTVALTNNQYNIINPAGALLALTVNLPSSPANNDCVFIKFTQNVTTVTYGNGTVVDGIVGPVAGSLVILVFDSSSSSWY